MRYLPHTEDDRRAMLAAIGAPSVDALFRDVPPSARLDGSGAPSQPQPPSRATAHSPARRARPDADRITG